MLNLSLSIPVLVGDIRLLHCFLLPHWRRFQAAFLPAQDTSRATTTHSCTAPRATQSASAAGENAAHGRGEASFGAVPSPR